MEIELEHKDMVNRLKKQGYNIKQELTGNKCDIMHMAIGVAGEAGELLDAIKKHVIYNKALDVDNVIEELGDLEFYMQGLRETLGISRVRTLNENIKKLDKRYNQGTYTDADARNRADKGRRVMALFEIAHITGDEGVIVAKENDVVNHPPHYNNHPSGIECIDVTQWFNFNLGNVIKYIWRAPHKGCTIQDLEKAEWYIGQEIKRLRMEIQEKSE